MAGYNTSYGYMGLANENANILESNMYESSDKLVSHPPHYQSETGLEVIDVIEAFTFDLSGI